MYRATNPLHTFHQLHPFHLDTLHGLYCPQYYLAPSYLSKSVKTISTVSLHRNSYLLERQPCLNKFAFPPPSSKITNIVIVSLVSLMSPPSDKMSLGRSVSIILVNNCSKFLPDIFCDCFLLFLILPLDGSGVSGITHHHHRSSPQTLPLVVTEPRC